MMRQFQNKPYLYWSNLHYQKYLQYQRFTLDQANLRYTKQT